MRGRVKLYSPKNNTLYNVTRGTVFCARTERMMCDDLLQVFKRSVREIEGVFLTNKM